ncbi:MAG: PD40 domain-containing protein [Elusimicrobia bacterium]|nr:PD40 domain-containing protein [Elusimicrobiota bacterium]
MRFQSLALFFLITVAGLWPVNEAGAQAFGKNRLLTRKYPYKIWETDHFKIHYYEENPLLLEECARYLEAAYADVTDLLDAKPNKKLPFFLYTNHNEFEQTRIVNIGEGTGGVTEAFKDRLLIFNNGSMAWLKHVIFHEFTHEVQFAILNEGFWKSARLLKSILYPLWLMEGSAEYASGNIDTATDLMYARDAATSQTSPAFSVRDLHNFNHLKPNQVTKAYKQGGTMMEFIVEEYGRDKLGKLFKSYRERFDAASVLIDVLGLDDERFDRNFREWLEEKYGEPAKRLDEPTKYGPRLTAAEPPVPVFNWSPAASPDGGRIFFIGMREGYPAVYELDLKSGRKSALVGRNFRQLDWIALDNRNLSVSADGRYLYFIGEKNLKDYLYRYDRNSKDLKRYQFSEFSALKSPAPDPADPNRVALGGMDNGFYDLYIVDLTRQKIAERITSDPQDDDDPAFLPDGSGLIYSTEVGISSQGFPNRDLYLWRKDSGIAESLTQGPHIEKEPAVSPDGKRILFVSDEDGTWDLYELNLEGNKITRRTRVIGGAFSPNYLNGDILFAGFRDGEVHAYRGTFDALSSEDKTQVMAVAQKPAKRIEKELPQLDYKGPYRPRFGTDLFFPAFFFSTQGGFFAFAYWQGSDMLGYHNMGTNLLLNSGSGILDYSIGYSFARFRPELQFVFKGSHYRDPFLVSDKGEDLRKKEHLQAMFVSYPLDRQHRIEAGTQFVERYHTFPSDPVALTNLQDLRLIGQFVRDTTTGPYLVVTKGSRLALGVRRAVPMFEFDLDYVSKFAEWHQFIPIGKDSAVASRFEFNRSYGPSYEVFPLTGQGGVRGYAREPDSAKKRGTLVNNLELRFPLFPDVNYHMWYIFPDFYIKNIYLNLFSDQGVRWDDETEDFWRDRQARRKTDILHSAGFGLRFNTFILETFPFFFTLEWAKRTASNGGVLYGSVVQYFLFQ